MLRYSPLMAAPIRRLRAPDGTEQVLLPLADFVALVDAASRATHGDPDQDVLVEALRAHFEAGEPSIPIEDFLAAYDAAHDAG